MTTKFNPYVVFWGNARQAMEFYQRVFGGTLTLTTYGELGRQHPDGADKIVHSVLDTDIGFTLMGADAPPEMPQTSSTNVALFISGTDTDTMHGYWKHLSDGGTVLDPLAKQDWGNEKGACMDSFGTSWLVEIVQPRS
ncbi:VOC family protein [Nocardia terpenica]|uniref:VOC family protein n=1 Tax=Nocardia terpenica TaxID=455432 RepID=A0A6G9Z6U8_9NOCA|nr:VOC family protein [Nocardia terpenica]QIS21121.1 VOC family protein [Nocardia terpenica]